MATRRKGHRIRRRTIRRWAVPGLALVTLLAALATVVRRGEQGRLLSRDIATLDSERVRLEEHATRLAAVAESLASLGRIELAAGAIGMRRATGSEVRYLKETGAVGFARTREPAARTAAR